MILEIPQGMVEVRVEDMIPGIPDQDRNLGKFKNKNKAQYCNPN